MVSQQCTFVNNRIGIYKNFYDCIREMFSLYIADTAYPSFCKFAVVLSMMPSLTNKLFLIFGENVFLTQHKFSHFKNVVEYSEGH